MSDGRKQLFPDKWFRWPVLGFLAVQIIGVLVLGIVLHWPWWIIALLIVSAALVRFGRRRNA